MITVPSSFVDLGVNNYLILDLPGFLCALPDSPPLASPLLLPLRRVPNNMVSEQGDLLFKISIPFAPGICLRSRSSSFPKQLALQAAAQLPLGALPPCSAQAQLCFSEPVPSQRPRPTLVEHILQPLFKDRTHGRAVGLSPLYT